MNNDKLRWQWRALVLRLLVDIAKTLWQLRILASAHQERSRIDVALERQDDLFKRAERVASEYDTRLN